MKRFKKLLAESAKKVENSKMTTETWGNISIRDQETGYVFLPPAGIKYCDMTEDDVVALALKDARISEAVGSGTVVKKIYVPMKILNLVIKP